MKTKTMQTQKLSKPWITASLCRSIDRKIHLNKDSMFDPSHNANFKIYRKTLHNFFNATKKYYPKHFESATDIETT